MIIGALKRAEGSVVLYRKRVLIRRILRKNYIPFNRTDSVEDSVQIISTNFSHTFPISLYTIFLICTKMENILTFCKSKILCVRCFLTNFFASNRNDDDDGVEYINGIFKLLP